MEQGKRYEKLINYLTDYIYTVTIRDGVVVETDHGPGCVSVTGYTSEDYKKDPELWYRMVYKRDREKVLNQARLALSGQEADPLEHRIVHRDGSIRWIRNKIVLTKDESGKPIAYDGLINDITQLKKAEVAAAIRNEQLKQADKLASLGILVSGIAHEINNPNNFIMLNVQLFTKVWRDIVPLLDSYYAQNGDFSIAGMPYSLSKDKIAQSLDGILQGSERIQKITKNLTDYSRADTGQLNEEVDVNKVAEMAILITGNLIKKSTDRFRVDYGADVPPVKGNLQQLEQVVINLINNACQSLKNPAGAIEVSTYYSKARDRVRIKVQDEGIGISASDLQHIMDPFFTTKREMGGTGLGLSVSYSIVKSHGGSMILNSTPGKGTVAQVSLPAYHPPLTEGIS
ncbi:MAG TPA: HAMP domain-containing sensor histidine kinase [Bacteroidota bacterium]|nr:HAMP domain-containing sensor histidine kinase [Bacteroidota bacterium]